MHTHFRPNDGHKVSCVHICHMYREQVLPICRSKLLRNEFQDKTLLIPCEKYVIHKRMTNNLFICNMLPMFYGNQIAKHTVSSEVTVLGQFEKSFTRQNELIVTAIGLAFWQLNDKCKQTILNHHISLVDPNTHIACRMHCQTVKAAQAAKTQVQHNIVATVSLTPLITSRRHLTTLFMMMF